jgi:HEAT repeat protein
MATEALGNGVHKPFIQRILAKAMNDPDVGVRMSALCASGRLHRRRHLQVLTRAIESRFEDPELIYDEPFGAHVRRIQEGHEHSLRHFLDGRPKNG